MDFFICLLFSLHQFNTYVHQMNTRNFKECIRNEMFLSVGVIDAIVSFYKANIF